MDISPPTFSPSTPLHVGDYIVIRLSKPDEGWLSSEGLLDDECFLSTDTEDFHNSIWQIHVQNQYSATREYKEALSQSILSSEGVKDSSVPARERKQSISNDYLSQLHRAALNEQRLNDKLMSLKMGKPINFGDPIQLRHVKSRKFLTISANVLAREERENMRISVDSDGDSLSCIAFAPRYRYEREGQALTNNSEILIRVHERPGEYLHSAKSSSSNAEKNEVNCSLESSFWTVLLYQRVADADANTIMAGELVTLQDPDSLSCISLDTYMPGVTEKARVVLSPQEMTSESTVGTHLLWLVEKTNVVRGGPLLINMDSVTFRDLNTGLYMRLEADGLVAVKERSLASTFELHSSQSGNQDSNYLEANSAVHLASGSFWIGNSSRSEACKSGTPCVSFVDKNSAISLSISSSLFHKIGAHLHVGVEATMKLRRLLRVTRDYEEGHAVLRDLSQEVKSSNSVLESLCSFLALTDQTTKNDFMDNHNNKEVITVRQNMVREQGLIDALLDLLSITESNIYDKIREPIAHRNTQTTRQSVRKMRKNSVPKKEESDKEITIPQPAPPVAAGRPQRRSSFSLLLNGSKGKQTSNLVTLPVKMNADRSTEPKGTDRQKNAMELVALRKHTHQHNTNDPEDSDEDDDDDEDDELDDDEQEDTNEHGKHVHLTVSQLIAQKCLKVLLCVLIDNFTNQLYIADRFPTLLAEVKDHRLAVLCVEEMLRENLTILQTKVRQREIDIFVNFLAKTEMSVTFLRLLQSTCSCPMGVDATQRMVAQALFGTHSPARSRTTSNVDEISSTSHPHRSESRKSLRIATTEIDSSGQRLIIQIIPDRQKKIPVDWGDLSLYCFANAEQVVQGYPELANGLPEIWLSWKMKGKNNDLSMHQLFGYREKVPLALICFAARKSIAGRNKPNNAFQNIKNKAFKRKATVHKKKNTAVRPHQPNQTIVSIANLKAQVAEYFRTQLYLVADLCLDRNYVAIGMLEPLYPYDVLIAMLMSHNIPPSFKAPVCRILRCLYVDRDPQVEVKFPHYIRTSVSLLDADDTEMKKKEENENKLSRFALIQKILSNYVHNELDLSYSDELSTESLELLEALVQFGFYEKVPQILDILKPLLRVLESHQFSAKKKTEDTPSEDLSNENESMKPRRRSIVDWSKKWIADRSSKYSSLNRMIQDDEDTVNEKEKIPWYRKWVERTESLTWMIAVFSIVILSVAAMVVELVNAYDLTGFFEATTVFFGLEYLFRLVVNVLNTKNVIAFVFDIFNVLDLGLIAMDVIMLSLGSHNTQASATRATRSLRIIRIVRTIRLFRAAQLLKRMTAGVNSGKDWEIPQRYQNIKRNEAKTMVNILKVLTMFYDRIQDNTLDLGLRAFQQWNTAVKNHEICDAVDVFYKALTSEERLSSELSNKFEAVLLDAIMFSDKDITHAALNLLMIHKSQKDLFLNVFENIQIIYSPRIERVCAHLTAMLRELQGLAEMFEIWSELESDDDLKSASRCLEILNEIMAYLSKKNDDRTLAIRSLTLVDEEVQNLLRNLDAMTTFMALQESLFDGGREELKPQVVKILTACNELICMFVKTSETNQGVTFKYLQWFVDRVDDGIDSSKVARCIVEGNKSLIKQCSRKYLSEFAHKIVSQGRKPEYLDLFVGMTELAEVMDAHVLVVETEISSFLTGREWKKHILLWCAVAGSSEYMERRAAMQPLAKHDSSLVFEHQLSPDLRYHIRVLSLLACCNLGPKLYAIYPVQDIVFAILDPATIFPVKKALGILLIEMLKSSGDRVEKVEQFWQLLDHVALEMETLPTEMLTMVRNHELRIQRGEWLEISAGIITSFFQDFDMNHYLDNRVDKAGRSQNDAKVTIERLYRAIRSLVDVHTQKIGGALMEELLFASQVLQSFVDPDSAEPDSAEGDDSKLKLARQQHKRTSVVYADVQQLYLRKQFKIFLRHIKDAFKTSREEMVGALKTLPRVRDAVDADVCFEPFVKKLTSHFRSSIKRSPLSRSVQESAVETCGWFLRVMRHLFEDALGATFEALQEARIEPRSDAVEELRTVYNENGVTYLCLDLIAVGVDHSLYIEAMKLLVTMLRKSGGCRNMQKSIYLYLVETDSVLFFELVKDMIESLKAWANKESESALLTNSNSSASEAHANANANTNVVISNADKLVPEEVIVLDLLQGVCEGSFMGNREQLREQTGNSRIINVLESLASFVGALSRSDAFVSHTKTVLSLLRTVLRLLQGPCKGNQEQFVLHTELLISLNRMIRSARPMRANTSVSATKISSLASPALSLAPSLSASEQRASEQFEHLKESIVDLLRGAIEGQAKSSLVFDRVATTIDFSVLQLLLLPPDQELLETIIGPQALSPAQAKFIVLTESMRKHASLTAESAQSSISSERNDISSVEVRWNNHVQVLFFPVPQFVRDLSAESKQKLLEHDQDFASHELKLLDFVHRVKTVHRESKHQQWLKRYGLSDLWTAKYYLTRLMFANAVVMNCVIIAYYGIEYHDHKYFASHDPEHRLLASSGGIYNPRGTLYVPPHINSVLNYLNILQLVLAAITVGVFALVKMPVTFSSELEKRAGNFWTSALFTVLEPMPIWYTTYFVFTFLGLKFHHFFLSALLLDWVVLDSTTQDLLLAVQYPARQLAATLVLIFIMHNIFAGVMFEFFRQDVVTVPLHTMWDALKLCISYGFRGEYGIDHEMQPTLGVRMVLDAVYFFVMLSILRHIFFAIIVDTFVQLRELKLEREMEAKNTCFICDIERHDFDRMLPEGSSLSFSQHRSVTHNPLNYMAFIMNIWQQSESEDSSLEMYVRECLRKGDVSWFPAGMAHHESSHSALAEAHVVEESGSGGGGGGGSHKNKHGHSHKHSHAPSTKDTHTTAGDAAAAVPLRRPRTAGGEATGNAELMERMASMQQQLVNISKSMQFSAVSEPHSPTRTSFLNTSTSADVSAEPALLQAVTRMNAAIAGMMARIDTMEKNITKNNKYLRHRLRGVGKPNPLSQSPAKAIAQLVKKKSRADADADAAVHEDIDLRGETDDERDAAVHEEAKGPNHTAELESNQSPQVSEDGRPAPIPLVEALATFAFSNDFPDVVQRGGEKLEQSDDESSLTSSQCTRRSDLEETEERVMKKENVTAKRPHPNGSPVIARPVSAAVARSAPMSAAAARPQSALNAQRPASAKVTFTGPPKSLISNDAWK